MAKYSVYFTQAVSVTVDVDAEDPDEAIDKAYDEAPSGICAQCSGWGQDWGRDDDGELTPVEVTDAEGNIAWSESAES